MNLLDKICSGLLIIAALSIFSCEDPSEVGLGLDPNGLKSGVTYTELVLPVHNILVDSIRTDNDPFLRIGAMRDDIFGFRSISSNSRLSIKNLIIDLPEDSTSSDGNITYTFFRDSLNMSIELSFAKYIANDASVMQSFTLRQLGDQIIDGTVYLSTYPMPLEPFEEGNEFNYMLDSDAIASNQDTVEFEIGTAWMDELWEIAQLSNPNQALEQDFKGISIIPNENNSAIFSLDFPVSSSDKKFDPVLKINYGIYVKKHYEDLDIDSIETIMDTAVHFSINGKLAYFNSIKTDLSGSLIGNSIGAPYEKFNTTDNNVYLNAMSGIHPVLDMDTVVSFLADNEIIPYKQINRFEVYLASEFNDKSAPNNENTALIYYYGRHDDQENGEYTKLTNSRVIKNSNLDPLTAIQDTTFIGAETLLNYGGEATQLAQSVESGNLEFEEFVAYPIISYNGLQVESTSPNTNTFIADSARVKIFYTTPN